MYTLNEKINMKFFKIIPTREPGDNETPVWKAIVKLFNPGKDVKGNENFLGIERTITRARNDYDTARRQALYRLLDRPQLDTIKELE